MSTELPKKETRYTRLREEEDGFSYGSWNGVDDEEMGYSTPGEIHLTTRLANIHGRTDIGGPRSKYQVNEDSAFVVASKDHANVGVLDGAGGSDQGRLAGYTLSLELARCFRSGMGMKDALLHGDMEVRRRAPNGYATGVVVRVGSVDHGSLVTIGCAGDSKAMTLRQNKRVPEGTTTFQNMAQRKVNVGRIAPHEYYTNRFLNIITGGFGIPRHHAAERVQILITIGFRGDRIVAGSDGFWDNVSEYEIEQLSQQCRDSDEFQRRLYTLAYERNNTLGPFIIQHSADIRVEKQLSYEMAGHIAEAGDNLSVFVIELTNIDQ